MIPDMNTISSTGSFRRLRTIVLGSGERPQVASAAPLLRQQIEQAADVLVWDLEFEQDLSQVDADLVIVLGGDGSILRAAHQMGRTQLPVVGVNLGKLGFLADLSPDDLLAVLPALDPDNLPEVEHLMFDCEVRHGGDLITRHLGLNELAVLGGPPFSILEVHLYVDSELVTTYSCDGLIVSTPIGSTAHSLSAGGPILRKNLQAFVISPISPHTLTNRPLVDSASLTYELVVSAPNPSTSAVVDGRVVRRLEPEDRVRIRRADCNFRLVNVPGRSYYKTLREKLGWGGNLIYPPPSS